VIAWMLSGCASWAPRVINHARGGLASAAELAVIDGTQRQRTAHAHTRRITVWTSTPSGSRLGTRLCTGLLSGSPNGIRTRVFTLRGWAKALQRCPVVAGVAYIAAFSATVLSLGAHSAVILCPNSCPKTLVLEEADRASSRLRLLFSGRRRRAGALDALAILEAMMRSPDSAYGKHARNSQELWMSFWAQRPFRAALGLITSFGLAY
jgi:hypothetical protein